MIPATLTNTQKIERALAQAGELGLTQPEIATVTGLEIKVVSWTLNNLRAAGRVQHSGERYEHGRHWYLTDYARPDVLPPGSADPLTHFDKSDKKFERVLRAVHPHGYEDARLMPMARLVGNRVA